MKRSKTKVLFYLSTIISFFTFSCNGNQSEKNSFEIKNGSYYSTLKLTDEDFSGQSVTYLIDTTNWDVKTISKTEMDEIFLKCTSISKNLFRNSKELRFLSSYEYDGIQWKTKFDKLFDTEGPIERNGKNLLLIIKGIPKDNISTNSYKYGDGKTWLLSFYVEGDKINEPTFKDISDDVPA